MTGASQIQFMAALLAASFKRPALTLVSAPWSAPWVGPVQTVWARVHNDGYALECIMMGMRKAIRRGAGDVDATTPLQPSSSSLLPAFIHFVAMGKREAYSQIHPFCPLPPLLRTRRS